MITLMIFLLVLVTVILVVAIAALPVLIIPAFVGFDIVVGIWILRLIFGRKKKKEKKK